MLPPEYLLHIFRSGPAAVWLNLRICVTEGSGVSRRAENIKLDRTIQTLTMSTLLGSMVGSQTEGQHPGK